MTILLNLPTPPLLLNDKHTEPEGQARHHAARQSAARSVVEEAVVDCYNESEQIVGLYTKIEDNLALPFETKVLGVRVTVQRVNLTQRDEIVVVCRRAGVRQTVPILDLPLLSPRPAGSEWIDAYRHWLGGR